MKRNKIFAITLAALLLLSGCGGGEGAAMDMATNSTEAADKYMTEPEAPAAAPEPTITLAPEYSMSGAGESVYQRADAKLIRRCSMELQTTEFDSAITALYELVDSYDGYFENSSVYGGGYYNANARRTGEYVIRIPAENYNAFRSSVGDLGYVSFNNESSEDVGERYYDTEARLKTLRTKQDRLLMLLEKAETMEDIITLESALSEVEHEIEQYSSTLNRYDGLISFSTFTINVYEMNRIEEQTGQADSLGKRMSAGFRSGLEDLKDSTEDFMVWLSYHFVGVVVLMVAVGIVILVIRRENWKFHTFKGRKKRDTEE